MVFLHHQEIKLRQSSDYMFGHVQGATTNLSTTIGQYAKNMFPQEADTMVLNLRRWIHDVAGGGPVWGRSAAVPSSTAFTQKMPPSTLFNVYESHVKHCRACRGALKNLQLARNLLFASAAVVSLLSRGWKGILGGGALASVGVLVQKFMGLFYEYRYNHQDNN